MMKTLAAVFFLGLLLGELGTCVQVGRNMDSLQAMRDGPSDEYDNLLKKKQSLEKDIEELKNRNYQGGINTNLYYNNSGYMIMSYTLGSLGGAIALILIFGGVRLPKTSNVIVFGYGFGAVGYSIIWFGVDFTNSSNWYSPFVASYMAGLVLGTFFICAAVSLPVGSLYSITMLGAIEFMIFGVMLNTIGIYKTGGDNGPYFTFSITAGVCFCIGAILYYILAICQTSERRFLAMSSYTFIGSYLFVKLIGIATNTYPAEWGDLQFDPKASTWQYDVMFTFTFVCALLTYLFQYFVYPPLADDEYVEGGPISKPRLETQKTISRRDMPTHATTRRLLSGQRSSSILEEPQFGGLHAPYSSSSSQRPKKYERYVSNF